MMHKKNLITILVVIATMAKLHSMEEKRPASETGNQSREYQADQIQRCLTCCLNNDGTFCPNIDQAFRMVEQISPTILIQGEPLIRKLVHVALHYKNHLGRDVKLLSSPWLTGLGALFGLTCMLGLGICIWLSMTNYMNNKPLNVIDLWGASLLPTFFLVINLNDLARRSYLFNQTDLESVYAMISLTYRRLQEQNTSIDDDTRNYIKDNLCNQTPIPATLAELCAELNKKEEKID